MEHRGLVKALNFLAESSVQIETLITDRHKQIAKYMREHKPSIDHHYDVWHVSKDIIINYLYIHTTESQSRDKEKAKLCFYHS